MEDKLILVATCMANQGFVKEVRPFLTVSKGFWTDEGLWDAMKDVTPTGKTRLMYCAKEGKVERLKWLIKRGANMEAKGWNSYTYTALMWACHQSRLECVIALCEAGVNIEGTGNTYNGITPLMLAAWWLKEDVVMELLRRGANKNAKSTDGKNASNYARLRGNHLFRVINDFVKN